jgi:hypothetical protein
MAKNNKQRQKDLNVNDETLQAVMQTNNLSRTKALDAFQTAQKKKKNLADAIQEVKGGGTRQQGSGTQTTDTPSAGNANAPDDPNRVTDEASAEGFINREQSEEIARDQTPPTRDGEQAQTQSAVSSLVNTTQDAPEQPDLTERFKELREDAGLENLETRLSTLRSEKQEMQAQLRERARDARGEAVPTNVIEGRISQMEFQNQQRINQINREINHVATQIEQKTQTVERLMQYEQTEYENAVDRFDANFNRAMNIVQVMQDQRRLEMAKDQEERQRLQEVKAVYQATQNSLAQAGVTYGDLSQSQQSMIEQQELQLGIPRGTMAAVLNNKTGGEVTRFRTSFDDQGREFAWGLVEQPDGTAEIVNFGYTGARDADAEEAARQEQMIDVPEFEDFVQQTKGSEQAEQIIQRAVEDESITNPLAQFSPDRRGAATKSTDPAQLTEEQRDNILRTYLRPVYETAKRQAQEINKQLQPNAGEWFDRNELNEIQQKSGKPMSEIRSMSIDEANKILSEEEDSTSGGGNTIEAPENI